jgi:hypothetical protein
MRKAVKEVKKMMAMIMLGRLGDCRDRDGRNVPTIAPP